MTEIIRSIEIDAPLADVWDYVHPANWKKIFYFVQNVNGYTDGKAGVGTQATVVAGGNNSTEVKYQVKITEFVEKEKIVYKRYGGPLNGEGIIQLKPLNEGTLMRRKGIYTDDLSEEVMHALSEGMEKDNLRIKRIIEGAEKPL